MKKVCNYLLVLAIIFSIIACNSESNKTSDSDESNTENTDEVEHITSPEELARITPDDIDINTPIPVTKLYNSFFEWKDKEVTITGYMKMYLDSDELKESVEIIGEPGAYDILFDCTFKETPGETVNEDDMVTIKGTIKDNSYFGIQMIDCEFIGVNKDYSDEKELNPYNMPKEPILAQNLFDVYNAWIGMEATVIGYYNSTTTSTLIDNVIWRIDLADPESGEKKVGCRMQIEPDSDYLKDNRNDVVIKGVISEETFGRVILEDCVFVK